MNKAPIDTLPFAVRNNLRPTMRHSIRILFFMFFGAVLLDSVFSDKYVRNGDVVSLKSLTHTNGWMSCWVSGSRCKTRACEGPNAPFAAGSHFKHNYKCRGEVFWIHGDTRGPSDNIRVCDRMALQYSNMRGSYWWLSDNSGCGWFYCGYKTATCPGKNFANSKFTHKHCDSEIFTIKVNGRACGEKVQDRDVLNLRKGSKYVGGSKGGNLERLSSPHPWRIYKH